ncbi:MAG TPA: TonB-dependent receptor [Caulobacteraceae bacterium]|nr:TonB-dependent receptor [Caulobacteraceae bacterium]
MADTAVSASAPGQVQELIVTAQKREENIKDVPISISAVSGATLTQHGFVNFNDLATITPNMLSLQEGDSRTSTIEIRGVSTQQADIGQQASIGVFIDGVFMSRTGMGTTQDFVDIQRIEVLRGPQGTLFGMNTAGGLINIITQPPSLTGYRGEFEASYGSYNDVRVRGMVTGPIVPDELGFSLAGYSDNHDGYTYDPVRNEHVDNLHKDGVRGKLEFKKDDFDATITADYQHETSQCCSVVISSVLPGGNSLGYPVAPVVPPGSPYNRETIEDGVNTNPNSGGGITAELNWHLPIGTITSLASYREWDAFPISDVDELPFNLLDGFAIHQNHKQASEELRFTSPSGQKLEYVVGLFYFWRHSTEFDTLPIGSDASFLIIPGEPGPTYNYEVVDDASYAVFGHLDYHLTDQLTISGGLRYSAEPQTALFVQRSTNVIFPDLGPDTARRDDRDLTWQTNLSYKVTPDVTAYASIATGFKPGGFDLTRLANLTGIQFEPETNIDYELGLKSDLLDHKLSIDVALYWTNYDNFQALAWDGTNLITRNAASFVSRGVEFEINARPIEGLTLSANGSYLDAHFTSFPDGQCPPGVAGVCDQSGLPLSGAPKWTFNVSGNYERPVTSKWNGFIRFDVGYKSLIETSNNDPNTYLPGYAIANARIGVRDQHGLEVSLFANNLTDTKYKNYVFGAPLATGVYVAYLGDPRVVGVELRKSF